MATPNAPSRPTCPLGVSDLTLSALHDDALSTAQATQLVSHVETCPACRERLAGYDTIAARLRSERPPEPDAYLWQAVSAAAASPEHAARSPLRRWRQVSTGSSRPSLRGLRAIAALILITTGLAALFILHHPSSPAHPTPTATPSSSATPSLPPQHSLIWQPIASPSSGVGLGAIQPAGDGESAYACAVGSDAHGNSLLQIWRTADRGVLWSLAREVPSEPTANGCSLVVDASDPSVAALAWLPRGGGAGDAYTGLMTTVNGGVTWQATPSSPSTRIDQLDSRDGVIYAVRETVDSSNSIAYNLWSSSDRMRTWRQVDHGLSANVAGFWLQPDGAGILLVLSSGGGGGIPTQLWLSPEDGANWHQLTVPGGLPLYTPARIASFGFSATGIVARSIQGQFHICVTEATVGDAPSQIPALECSTDSGQNWQVRATLSLDASQGVVLSANFVEIADDGTLLASGPDTLYRLAAGSESWQSLGTLPQTIVVYCPTPSSGILWAVPGTTGTNGNPQNHPFIAPYTN